LVVTGIRAAESNKFEPLKEIAGKNCRIIDSKLDKNEGKKIYIGIDNTHGDMWVEEFKSLATCKRWLVDTHRTN